MSGEVFFDLKVAQTDQIVESVSLTLLRTWIAEGRLTTADFVRPIGAQNWIKLSLAPEFAGQPIGRKQTRPLPQLVRTGDQRRKPTGKSGSESEPDPVTLDLGIVTPARSRPRKKRWLLGDAAIDMTPMIDVTFQLLIFFMLTNKAANPSFMEVPKVFNGQGVDPWGRQIVLVDANSSYYLGDQATPENQIGSLDDLANRVRTNATSIESETSMEVIIQAHKQSRHRAIRDLMEKLSSLDGLGPIRIGVEERD